MARKIPVFGQDVMTGLDNEVILVLRDSTQVSIVREENTWKIATELPWVLGKNSFKHLRDAVRVAKQGETGGKDHGPLVKSHTVMTDRERAAYLVRASGNNDWTALRVNEWTTDYYDSHGVFIMRIIVDNSTARVLVDYFPEIKTGARKHGSR